MASRTLTGASNASGGTGPGAAKVKSGSAEERDARKAVSRIEKQIARIDKQEKALNDEMAASLTDSTGWPTSASS